MYMYIYICIYIYTRQSQWRHMILLGNGATDFGHMFLLGNDFGEQAIFALNPQTRYKNNHTQTHTQTHTHKHTHICMRIYNYAPS